MRFVSSDEELGLSGEGTFEDAVVIIRGGDNGDPFCGLNKMGNGADGPDPSVGFLFAKAELFLQNTVELGQDKGGEEKVDLPSADARKELVRLAPWKGKGGDQHVGSRTIRMKGEVIDGPHGRVDPHLPPSESRGPELAELSTAEASASVVPQGTGARPPAPAHSWFGFLPWLYAQPL
jgi:hypothetical protein